MKFQEYLHSLVVFYIPRVQWWWVLASYVGVRSSDTKTPRPLDCQLRASACLSGSVMRDPNHLLTKNWPSARAHLASQQTMAEFEEHKAHTKTHEEELDEIPQQGCGILGRYPVLSVLAFARKFCVAFRIRSAEAMDASFFL